MSERKRLCSLRLHCLTLAVAGPARGDEKGGAAATRRGGRQPARHFYPVAADPALIGRRERPVWRPFELSVLEAFKVPLAFLVTCPA